MKHKLKDMLRRFLAIVLGVAVTFTAIPVFPVFAAETTGPAISIDSKTVTAGNGFIVYVRAADFEQVAGLEVAVHYDEDIFTVSGAYSSGLANGAVVDINDDTPGVVKQSIISVDGISGSGNLMYIQFQTSRDLAPGEYNLNLTISEAYDTGFQNLTLAKTSGTITVEKAAETVESISFYSSLNTSEIETVDTFEYTFQCGNISDLAGGEFTFTYDAEYLEVADVTLSDALQTSTAAHAINTKTAGYIKISYTDIEAINESYGTTFFTIQFKAKDKPIDETKIDFSANGLIGEDLVALSCRGFSNTVTILEKPEIVTYPPFLLTWDGVLNEGRTINVVASLPADTLISAGDFTINYDTSQLTCTSATADSNLSSAGGILVTKEDIGNGTVKFSYVNPSPKKDETALLHMTFAVTDQFIGETVLNTTAKDVVNENYDEVILDYAPVSINIEPIDISKYTIGGLEESYTYIGTEIKPEINIDGLTKDKDYTISYTDNVNVGNATIEIVGIGNYGGSITETFSITPAILTEISAENVNVVYDGKAHSINVTGVPNGGTVTYAISEDGEYTADNPTLIDAGSMTVFYQVDKDNYHTYHGSAKISIHPADLSEFAVSGIEDEYVYTGDVITPVVTIDGLKAEKDYTVVYKDNINVGTAGVVISGKGNYTGTIEKTFTIVPATMDTIRADHYDGIYDGKAHSINVTGVPEGATVSYALEKDGEYTENNPTLTDVGTLTVYYRVEKVNYHTVYGSATINIAPKDISAMAVTGIEESYIYSGAEIIPEINIEGLNESTDFDVVYTDNLNVGTAAVTITGKGNYTGTISEAFVIVPADMKGITASHYNGIYDGKAHSIKLNDLPEHAVVTYALEEDGEYADAMPELTNVGTLTVYFKVEKVNYHTFYGSANISIAPKDISAMAVAGIEESYIYIGAKINPEINIEGLNEGTDFDVVYTDNLNVGTVSVTVTGKGNYTGTITKSFVIHPAELSPELEVKGLEGTFGYSGSPIEPNISVEGLIKDTDYEVSYKNNQNTGTGIVLITGKGNYIGTIEKTFIIVPATMDTIRADHYDGIYDGKAHSISVTGVPEGATVSYALEANGAYTGINPTLTNVGTMTVYYKVEKTNYSPVYGSAEITILPVDIAKFEINDIEDSYTYTGQAIKPEISLKGLTEGEHYDVTYSDYVNVGTATITITGKGNYAGVITLHYNILPADLVGITVQGYEGTYDGQMHSISIGGLPDNAVVSYASSQTSVYTDNLPMYTDAGTSTVYYKIEIPNYNTIYGFEKVFILPANIADKTVSGIESSYVYAPYGVTPDFSIDGLIKDSDYTVSYADNLNVGTAILTITGIGNYNGTLNKEFTIVPKDISSFEVSNLAKNYSYTGAAIEPELVIEGLTRDKDFDVSYVDNVQLGTASIVVSGKGNYTGTLTLNFNIVPQTLESKTVELEYDVTTYDGKEKKPAVSIEGLIEDVDYEVSYSDHIEAGTATVHISGLGDYAGELTRTFIIQKASLQGIVRITGVTCSYDGKSHTIKVSGVPENAKVYYSVDNGSTYTETLPALTEVGELLIDVKVEGKNYETYYGSGYVGITHRNIGEFSISGLDGSYIYTGNKIEPEISVGNLVKKQDYTVSYINSTNVGTATVEIIGIGNYTGAISTTYEIQPAELTGVNVSGETCTYDTKDHSISVNGLPTNAKITYATKEDGSYSTSKPQFKNVGEYTVFYRIEKQNYHPLTGSASVVIKAKDIKELNCNIASSYVYTGSQIVPKVTLSYTGEKVTFRQSCTDNVNVGNASVTLTGYGNYTGSITKSFAITPAQLNLDYTVTGYADAYDGKAHGITIENVPVDCTLTYCETENGVYTSTRPTLTNVGKKTVYYKIEKNNYYPLTGSAQIVISAEDVKNLTFVVDDTKCEYNGKAQIPSVTIKKGDTPVTNINGIQLSYSNNVNAGTVTITVTGLGNYTGSTKVNYTIKPCKHKGTLVTIKGKSATCTKTGLTDGKKCSVCKTVTVAQKTIKAKGHVKKSTTTKATTSKNGKVVTKCATCKITLSTKTIYKASNIKLSTKEYVYNGKVKSPKVVVKDSKGKTISSSNYKLSKPSGRKNVGKYTYKVKFENQYSGSKTLTLTINPKATTLKKPIAAKKAITVKWTKVSKQATGYEIMVATNKKFTQGKKTVKVTSYKTTSKKITKLKAKKTYYVKVRTYKTVKGKTYYSAWSKPKTVKTK